MFNNMPEKSEVDSNLFWGAVDFALAQLSIEFKEPTVSHPPISESFTKYKKDISSSGDAIPVVVPVLSEEIVKTGGGVNHLNLIQIKGRPAHAWQPRILQDNVMDRSMIIRPYLYSVEVNRVLLKTVDTKK